MKVARSEEVMEGRGTYVEPSPDRHRQRASPGSGALRVLGGDGVSDMASETGVFVSRCLEVRRTQSEYERNDAEMKAKMQVT